MPSQGGFSLLETVVALAIATIIGIVLLTTIATALHAHTALTAREHSEAQINLLADRLQAEADSAWSIFSPPQDVRDQDNADGHEIDFFMRDAQSRPYFWAYRYDKSAQALQRYVYTEPGASATADGPPIGDIVNFRAQIFPLTAIADPSTPVFSPLYQGANLNAASVSFGFAAQPWIAGGNQIALVNMSGSYAGRSLTLSTQTAPSGFTVVLQYTPSPSPAATAAAASSSAMIETTSVTGTWRDCPNPRAGCSNDCGRSTHGLRRRTFVITKAATADTPGH